MAAPAMAQDLGTYRPGQAYQSVSSPGADVCNSHCAGDAQCRAWNYIKVNPKAAGVCEFLASASAPVQSPISISGENLSQQSYSRPLSQGGTNVVRVGTSTAPAPRAAAVTQTPNRRVVREAVPQRFSAQGAVHRGTAALASQRGARGLSLTEQQNQYRRQTGEINAAQRAINPRLQSNGQQNVRQQDPRVAALQQQNSQQRQQYIGQRPAFPQSTPFQPLLDGRAYPAAPIAAPQNPNLLRQRLRQNQAQGYQGQGYQTQGYQGQGYQGQGYQGQAFQPNSAHPNSAQPNRLANTRPPIGQPIGPVSESIAQQAARLQPRPQQSAPANSAQNLPRSSVNAPVTAQNARQAFARRQADLAAIASGNSVDPISQSLYGTLNDDVKVRAQLKTLPSDPNAPIATSASRPVGPVETQLLNELAGGPR